VLRPTGADLLPPRGAREGASLENDVRAFGALLFELVTGGKVPVKPLPSLFRQAAPQSGPAGVRAAAIRLAGKCLGYLPMKLTMQQAATEIRLLWVVSRQTEIPTSTEPEPAPSLPSPYLVTADVATVDEPDAAIELHAEAAALQTASAVVSPEAPLPREATTDGVAGPVVPLQPANFNKPPVKQLDLVPVESTCPKCDSGVVYEARARSGFERTLERWNIPICRCHRCYHRWVVFAGMRIAKNMPSEGERSRRPKRRN
jgi:hypothetical protein